jgi:hypothetical protein
MYPEIFLLPQLEVFHFLKQPGQEETQGQMQRGCLSEISSTKVKMKMQGQMQRATISLLSFHMAACPDSRPWLSLFTFLPGISKLRVTPPSVAAKIFAGIFAGISK